MGIKVANTPREIPAHFRHVVTETNPQKQVRVIYSEQRAGFIRHNRAT
jgi:hypothetical protein